MGVTWIVFPILTTLYLFDYIVYAWFDILDGFYLCFGIFYFVLLVLKRSTLELIMDR